METIEETCEWLAVLLERGFCHDNPQGAGNLFCAQSDITYILNHIVCLVHALA